MKISGSRTTERFRKAFEQLPPEVQQRARAAYRLWRADPWHSRLHFKQVHPSQPVYSVRVGLGWRAVGVLVEEQMIWFWIGSHSNYDNLLAQL